MKKITAILLATSTLISVASANTGTGFFGSLGLTTGAVTSKTDMTRASAAAATGNQLKSTGGKAAFGARFEAGYGMTFNNNLWAAISAYAGINSLKYTIYDDSSSTTAAARNATMKLRNKYTYGVEAKFGYHITKDTIAYISVAGEAGKYELTWQDVGSTPGIVPPSIKKSKTKFYVKPGVGFRTMFTKNMYVEMKYAMGFPQKVSFFTGVDTTANGGLLLDNRNVSTTIKTHEVTFAVGYKF